MIGCRVVIAAFALGPHLIEDAPQIAAAPHRRSLRARNATAFVFLGAIAFCSALGEGAMADWSAVFRRQVSRSSASTAAVGFAAFSCSMTLGRLLADRVTAVIVPVRVVRRGGACAAAGLLLAILAPAAPTAIADVARGSLPHASPPLDSAAVRPA